jgi:hypothetical protein
MEDELSYLSLERYRRIVRCALWGFVSETEHILWKLHYPDLRSNSGTPRADCPSHRRLSVLIALRVVRKDISLAKWCSNPSYSHRNAPLKISSFFENREWHERRSEASWMIHHKNTGSRRNLLSLGGKFRVFSRSCYLVTILLTLATRPCSNSDD